MCQGNENSDASDKKINDYKQVEFFLFYIEKVIKKFYTYSVIFFKKIGDIMARIPCPECNKKISEDAEACPKCGAPLTKENVAAAKEKQKKQNIGCLAVLLILFVIGFAMDKCSSDDDTSTASVQTQNTPILGMDAQRFAENFEANAAKLGLGLSGVKKENGFVMAKVGCCSNLSIFLTEDSPALVREAYLLMAPDGSKTAGAQIVAAMCCLIMTAEPDKSTDFRDKIIKDIGFEGSTLPQKSSAIRGNKKFWFQQLKNIGLNFGVSAVK